MPKRSNVVILSSDEEKDAKPKGFDPGVTTSSKASSRSRASSSAPRSSKPSKKARFSDCRSAPSKEQSGFSEFKSLYEDFTEDFAEFKVSAGLRNIDGVEPWVEKYRPRTVEELAVHKKKVEEVRVWLEDRLRVSKKQLGNHALLITGPAGVGKSATVQVLASHFGAELFEWDTPTPTIWQEHAHNNISGIRYISKLDEFENFVDRVRKFGLLPSSSSLTSSSTIESVILLIDDLPVVNGKISYRRLLKCLQLLAKSVQIPTVIVVTDYGGAEYGDSNSRSEELWLSVKNAGACKVAFNPITVNSVKKVLSRICRQEQCSATSEEIDFVASASEGDIRNAIQSLQYLCLNPRPKKNMLFSVHTPINSEGKTGSVKASECSPFPFGRDQTLTLFHALGKFLHNKRDTENTIVQGQQEFSVREGLSRLPLKMDNPEKVLCQAYGQARQVAEFLHENVLDFIDDEAVEDAWVVASYLSDVDCLLSSPHHMFHASYRAENITQSVAASVAVRGALFGNAHSSLPRWHTIRKPKLWQAQQSVRHNKYEIERLRSEVHGLGISSLSVISTEYRPILQWLRHQASSSSLHPDASDNEFNCIGLELGQCESTDDEIEDF